MIKAIVTTTINPPTKALKLFAQKKDWNLIIVGDLITPHSLFERLARKNKNVIYLSPKDQDKKYPKLSKVLGWKVIQRRNIGFVEAHKMGADVVSSVDDDNIPLPGWGENLILEKKTEVNFYKTNLDCFDPVGATNYPKLWHRGYPLQLIPKRDYSKKTKKTVIADVQADFWNGDPDIDAVCRMIFSPECKFNNKYFPLASNKISPFNSQNTFFTRNAIKDYFLFPGIGRMDDIWAGFYLQSLGYKVVYNKATVYQDRNRHDLVKDMKAEYMGYEYNLNIIRDLKKSPKNLFNYLSKASIEAFVEYKKLLK